MACCSNKSRLTPEQEASRRAEMIAQFKAYQERQIAAKAAPITSPKSPTKPKYNILHAAKDAFLGKIEWATPEKAKERLDICHSPCKHLIKATDQCSQCFCIVSEKVKHEKASCPRGFW